MAERVDVSRLSVAECMALGGGAGEPAKEEGLQGKLEKLVQEIGLEVEGVDRHLHTGLEDPERTQPTDPRGVIEEALKKTADITAVQLKISILERLETSLGEIELTEEQRGEWREFLGRPTAYAERSALQCRVRAYSGAGDRADFAGVRRWKQQIAVCV